jgi:hypothetical protein
LLGIAACLLKLFSGLFFPQPAVFYLGQIALVAILPIAGRRKTVLTIVIVYLLAALFLFGLMVENLLTSDGAVHFDFATMVDLAQIAMLMLLLWTFKARHED